MTESGFGHAGRIPSYSHRGQPDSRVMAEPPACIQNAMMTKDKKPFTYTPGGLDLSQIKTPSMARRLARQRSNEEQEHFYPHSNGYPGAMGGPPPPPPISGAPPPPPPPPPLVIHTPSAGAAKPETVIKPIGERPEIVIPENPIGMLRKTNSPYHWEQEKAEKERLGTVPKFVEKIPSPVMQQNQPTTFSQEPPATYTPYVPNNVQRQNYGYGSPVKQSPESPLHKPEPQYPAKPSIPSPVINQVQTRDLLQRQDSQFNKSPTPFGPQGSSPQTNGSPISPSPNNAWRQPEKRESPLVSASPQQRSPFSPTKNNMSPQFTTPVNNQSPLQKPNDPTPVYHTLPRASPRVQDNYANNLRQSPPRNIFNNTIYNNVRNEPRAESPKVESSNTAPWRNSDLTKLPQHRVDINSVQTTPKNNNSPLYKPSEQEQSVQLPWRDSNQNQSTWQINQQPEQNPWRQNNQNNPNMWKHQQDTQTSPQGRIPETRYQSQITIPVTSKKPQQQFDQQSQQQSQQPPPQQNREVVYVTQEPVYYDSPEGAQPVAPLWVKTQKEKTPPPEWAQRPLEGRKSLTRDILSPPREKAVEPEWVQKSNEMRSVQRDLSSPPLNHQTVQPTWSTKPSDNKTLPRDSQANHGVQNGHNTQGSRVVPIHVHSENIGDKQQPHLRIIVDMQNPQGHTQAQPPYSQPTQRIMRVLSPQLVRFDQPAPETTGNNRQQDYPSLNNQPKTRIIPIQIEGGGGEAPNRRVYYHHFSTEGPPRQSRSFRVLQTITGTAGDDAVDVHNIEKPHGFTDL